MIPSMPESLAGLAGLAGLADRMHRRRRRGRVVFPVVDATTHRPYPVTYAYGVADASYAAGRHTGEDHACPVGSLALATQRGTVVHAGPASSWGAAYGVQVRISTRDGLHDYAHNHLSGVLVKVGDKVHVGQVVGRTGNTGNSTGPHDHFEARPAGGRYGSDVDPVVVKRRPRRQSTPRP